jgi:hypothetical protein
MQSSRAVFEIQVRGRRLVTTDRLDEAQWAALAAARAGEGAKIVDPRVKSSSGIHHRNPETNRVHRIEQLNVPLSRD